MNADFFSCPTCGKKMDDKSDFFGTVRQVCECGQVVREFDGLLIAHKDISAKHVHCYKCGEKFSYKHVQQVNNVTGMDCSYFEAVCPNGHKYKVTPRTIEEDGA